MLMICLGNAICIFACYFMGAGFVASAFGARQEVFLPMFFICCGAYALGSLLKKLPAGVRLLAAAPVLLCLLLCKSLPEYLLVPIPFIIIAAVQLTGKYITDYYDFKSAYLKLLIFTVIFLLMLLFFGYMGNLGAYFTLFSVVAGILTLRMLRQDAAVYNSAKFALANGLPMIIFVAVMVILGNGRMLDAVLAGVGWVFKMLGRGILLAIGGIGYLLLLLFGKEEEIVQLAQEEAEDAEKKTSTIKKLIYKFQIGENKDNTALLIGLVVLVILIVAAVIVIAIVRRNRVGGSARKGASLEKKAKYVSAHGTTGSGAAHVRQTRANLGIRGIYKKWLKLLSKKRVELRRSDTSLDVLEKRTPAAYPQDAQRALREVYLKVRYDEGYSATGEDTRIAKHAYETLAATDYNGFGESVPRHEGK